MRSLSIRELADVAETLLALTVMPEKALLIVSCLISTLPLIRKTSPAAPVAAPSIAVTCGEGAPMIVM